MTSSPIFIDPKGFDGLCQLGSRECLSFDYDLAVGCDEIGSDLPVGQTGTTDDISATWIFDYMTPKSVVAIVRIDICFVDATIL